MKKIIVISILLLIVPTVIFFIFKSSKQVIIQEDVLKSRDLFTEFIETGYVTPRNRLEIKPPFAGRVEEILVNEGDAIKKGRIVIWMSSNERSAMTDAAKAISEKEYARWKRIYKPTPIVAPMDGFIILRQSEPGHMVNSSDAILVMADNLIVEANIDETDLRYVKIGSELKMYLDAYPDENFTGIVEHIAYEAKLLSNVTVYTIRINPIKQPRIFRTGMTATITIVAEAKKNTLSLPNSFITEKENKETVTVKKGNTDKPEFEAREVKTGISDGKFTEILSGLKQDETVVILKTKEKKNKNQKLP